MTPEEVRHLIEQAVTSHGGTSLLTVVLTALFSATATLAAALGVVGKWMRADVVELRKDLTNVQKSWGERAINTLAESSDELRLAREDRSRVADRFTQAVAAFDSALGKMGGQLLKCKQLSAEHAKHFGPVIKARRRPQPETTVEPPQPDVLDLPDTDLE